MSTDNRDHRATVEWIPTEPMSTEPPDAIECANCGSGSFVSATIERLPQCVRCGRINAGRASAVTPEEIATMREAADMLWAHGHHVYPIELRTLADRLEKGQSR